MFPPPLWGRVREGGRTALSQSRRERFIREVSATPHPCLPTANAKRLSGQGGKETVGAIQY
jgi:hypothetical protein